MNASKSGSPKCGAKVQMGAYTYAARSAERPCANAAKTNGYCAAHQRYVVTAADAAQFSALRASILGN
jgi:hypothetical protein